MPQLKGEIMKGVVLMYSVFKKHLQIKNKILLLYIIMIFSLTIVQAFEFDNIVQYSDDDMMVDIKNWWGFTLWGILPDQSFGNATLTSHENVAHVRPVLAGKDRVPMYYEIDFKKQFDNGLGKVYFTDLMTGKSVEKDYTFVERTYEDKILNYSRCKTREFKGTIEEYDCENVIDVLKDYNEVWTPINNNNILKGKHTIGIMIDVEHGEWVDAVWTLAGKKITRHASWNDTFHQSLGYAWQFNETSGDVVDSNDNFNLTNSNANRGAEGIHELGFNFSADDYVTGNKQESYNSFTISLWARGWPTMEDWAGLFNLDDGASFIVGLRRHGADDYIDFTVLGGTTIADVGEPVLDTSWRMYTFTYNGTHTTAYINGSIIGVATQSGDIYFDEGFDIGITEDTVARTWTNDIDEVYLWINRSLSPALVEQLHDYTFFDKNFSFSEVDITLLNPVDAYNSTNLMVDFRCNGNNSDGLLNLSLYIDGALNYTVTNSTPTQNLTISILRQLTDASHNWTCEGFNHISSSTASVRTMTLDATKPFINITSPIESFGVLTGNDTLNLNWTITDQNPNKCSYGYGVNEILNEDQGLYYNGTDDLSFWFYYDSTKDQHLKQVVQTIIPPPSSRTIVYIDKESKNGSFITTLAPADGSLSTIRTNLTAFGLTETGWHYLVLKQQCPSQCNKWHMIRISSKTDTSVNASDLINDTEVNCLDNTTTFNYLSTQDSLIFYANDTLGNENFTTRSWNISITPVSFKFNNVTTEGNLEDFNETIIVISRASITEVLFYYNGTQTTGESFISGDNNVLRINNFVVPNVDSDTNLSFFWSVTLDTGISFNLTSRTQLVLNLGLDNCTINDKVILNFTSVDEELQTLIASPEIETAVKIYSGDRSQLVLNVSNLYVNNPTTICISNNLTNSSNYSVDVIVRYEAADYANEYYNIVNLFLNNATQPQVITLYDLNFSDSTEFRLTFTGTDYLPVENALVFVERQYISENKFKTVELPKTDSNGQTILHLVRNDVIYNIIVVKNNSVLGNFENIVAFCEDFTIGDCKIDLSGIQSTEAIFNYDSNLGIIFNEPVYNETSRIISFNFLTSDGTSKTVTMEVVRNDIFGNRSVCNSTLTSSGGTLACLVGANVDETILGVKIFVNGEQSVQDTVNIDREDFGVGGYLILFVMVMSFSFFFSDNKNMILIGLIVSFAASIGLGMVKSDLIGIGASGVYLIVIVFIGFWKLNKRRKE